MQNNCASSPCQNGAKCIDTKNGYSCQCAPGWIGSTCTDDYNECSDSSVLACLNGGSCSNMHPPQRFQCSCSPEYYGDHCENRYDDCTSDTCGDHGFCIDKVRTSPGQKKYECRCEHGYELSSGSNPTCVDINECQNNPCYANVGCINYDGGFDCKACPTGMTGNGKYCEDINECLINNGGCSTTPKVQCRNKSPGFQCDPCPAGYEGDGRYCRKASICDVQNGGCSPLATCSEGSGGSVTCKCIPGYSGNGIGPDGCSTDGPTPPDCNINCNNGVCIIQNGKPQCLCYQGFTGDSCDESGDPCAVNPCKNGGTCTSVNGGDDFICQCTVEWSGKTCTDEATDCGGEFTSTTGAINYPLIDGIQYPPNAKCSWTITVTPGKSIKINFSKFDLETKHGSRCPDYLEIFDGDSDTAVGTYCGSKIPQVPDSVTNTYRLYFSSDSRNEASGFRLTWLTGDGVCGGIRNELSGSIKSPGYPNPYKPNTNCIWIIDVPAAKIITVQFNSLDIYQKYSCEDTLKVFNGLDQDYTTKLAEACGDDTALDPVVTTGPFATIVFASEDGNTHNSGFDISYTTQNNNAQCGGDLQTDFGEITSPGYPVQYDIDTDCTWKIVVGDGDHIALTFLDIDLEDSYDWDCGFDFIRIISGAAPNGDIVVAMFCGFHKEDLNSQECQPENLPEDAFCRPLPGAIVSIRNSMSVEFHSDGSNTAKGFKAKYEIGCGGYYDKPTQFTSPDYPNAYPRKRECDYQLHATNIYMIKLTFDSFALGAPAGDNCDNVFVKVYDGKNNQSELVLTACENRIPEPISSSENDLFLQFVTDGNPDDHGFLAHFEFELVGCGGVYDDDEGIVRSPGYPMDYPNNLMCTWYFRAKNNFIIELEFLDFQMEDPISADCVDFVRIYDSDAIDNSTLVGEFCTASPGTVHSTGQYLTMYMYTDFDHGEAGFEAIYKQKDALGICGGSLFAPSGTAVSPGYPNNYPPNVECIWIIFGPDNNKLVLSFTDFNLEYSDGCVKDYVEIKNGHTIDSPMIGTYCGHVENNNAPPESIESFANSLRIVFHSDDMVEDTGFSFTWDGTITGCGGEVAAIAGHLHSPNYPAVYPNNAECQYIIRTNLGSQLEITFDGFKLEEEDWDDGGCDYDWVQLFNGDKLSDSPLTDRLCGEQALGKQYVSNTSSVLLWFHSDDSGMGDEEGFTLHWDTSCGNHITNQLEGKIQSLNYPGKYAPNSYCFWIVKFLPGLDINVKFTDVMIETCDACSCDNLTVYNSDKFTEDARLATICGNSADDLLIEKEQGVVSFVFKSDDATEEYGFELEYWPTGGYQRFTDAAGEFKTPQYDTGLQQDAIFYWLIEVPQEDVTGNRVELTVDDDTNLGISQSTFVDCFNGNKPTEDKLIVTWASKHNNQKAHSTGPSMLVIMVVSEDDYLRREIKFYGKWTSLKGGECGGKLTSTTGAISSPNYPSNYPNEAECAWNVKIPQTGENYDDHIIFSFDFMDVEWGLDCWADVVEIFDGKDSSSTSLGTFCGQDIPPDTMTSGLNGYVKFTSDSSITGKGFHLTFNMNCGGTRNATDATYFISSPNYPNAYWKNTECRWMILAANTANKIFVEFTHFDTYVETKPGDPWENCAKGHFVQIYESLHPTPDIPKYCGKTAPPLYISHGSQVRVLFDGTYGSENKGRTGFMASYTTSGENCGGEIWSAEGNFMTPMYTEGKYPRIRSK